MTDDLIKGLDLPAAESLWNKDDPARPGDTVAGKVLRVDHRETDFGERPILTLHVETYLRLDKNGVAQPSRPDYTAKTVAVHCYASILAQRIDDCGVKVGGRIAIRYDGERDSKNGRTYKAWSVYYQPPAPGADLVAGLAPTYPDDEEPF